MDGSQLRVGVVVAHWNRDVTGLLEQGVLEALKECDVKDENILVQRVPGSFETIFGAKDMMRKHDLDAVVCLGVLTKGETMHFEYISEAVSRGVMHMNMEESIPVIFGILTCLTQEQALVRAQGENNHGYGWGMSAVEMALLGKK